MKRFTRRILLVTFIASFLIAMVHAGQASSVSVAITAAHPLTSTVSSTAVGGSINWGAIGAGIVCGGGIVSIAAGSLSGVFLPVAIGIATGVAGACVGAFAAS